MLLLATPSVPCERPPAAHNMALVCVAFAPIGTCASLVDEHTHASKMLIEELPQKLVVAGDHEEAVHTTQLLSTCVGNPFSEHFGLSEVHPTFPLPNA